MHFVDVVQLGTFFGPVAMTHRLSFLGETRQHDNHDATLLPDELPEVRGGLRHWALGRYVRRIARIVIGLKDKNLLQ